MNKQLPEQLDKVGFDLNESIAIVVDCVVKGMPLKKKVRQYAAEYLAGVLETFSDYLEDNRVEVDELKLDYNEITREVHLRVISGNDVHEKYMLMDVPVDVPGSELGFPVSRKAVPTVRVPL
jgi:hypothetical protein